MPQTPLEAHTLGAPINYFKAKNESPYFAFEGVGMSEKAAEKFIIERFNGKLQIQVEKFSK